jgi:hypothetical protein
MALESLDLGLNELGTVGLKKIIKSLGPRNSLVKFNFDCNDLDETAVEILRDTGLCRLQSLSLKDNDLEDYGPLIERYFPGAVVETISDEDNEEGPPPAPPVFVSEFETRANRFPAEVEVVNLAQRLEAVDLAEGEQRNNIADEFPDVDVNGVDIARFRGRTGATFEAGRFHLNGVMVPYTNDGTRICRNCFNRIGRSGLRCPPHSR